MRGEDPDGCKLSVGDCEGEKALSYARRSNRIRCAKRQPERTEAWNLYQGGLPATGGDAQAVPGIAKAAQGNWLSQLAGAIAALQLYRVCENSPAPPSPLLHLRICQVLWGQVALRFSPTSATRSVSTLPGESRSIFASATAYDLECSNGAAD
jgi:hypothetical protein